jgi:Fe-S oxidoreductase
MNAPRLSLSDAFTQRFARDLYHCSSCNYCVDAVWPERGLAGVCATLEHHDSGLGYSGRGFIEVARALTEGETLAPASIAERVFSCTTCGNCERVCPIGIRPAAVGRALRGELIAHGALPAALAQWVETLQARARTAPVTHPPQDAAPAGAAARLLYFAGCESAGAYAAESAAALALLHGAGLEPQVVSGACCGAVLDEIGCTQAGEIARAALTPHLVSATLIVHAAACTHQLARTDACAPMSFVEWLADALRDGSLGLQRSADAPTAIALVESCQFKPASRSPEMSARALLTTLGFDCTPTNFPSPFALCCGAAGGLPLMHAEAAARMAQARVHDGLPVVTLDPRCAAHLRASAPTRTIYGLAEFLVRHVEVLPRNLHREAR